LGRLVFPRGIECCLPHRLCNYVSGVALIVVDQVIVDSERVRPVKGDEALAGSAAGADHCMGCPLERVVAWVFFVHARVI
jgi:hypothetical protein